MTSPRISRRTLLRGAGGIAIGLPLLEEMRADASSTAVPVRAFNVFFGLGIPAPLQTEGYDGVLEPLRPLADRLLVLRNVDQIRCDESGINAHYDGSSGAFTAEPPNGEARAGGPSIDQVVRQIHYPDGQPRGVTPTVVAGTYFRRSRVSRYVHSYRSDGSVAAAMQEKPRDLFDRVFGRIELPGDAVRGNGSDSAAACSMRWWASTSTSSVRTLRSARSRGLAWRTTWTASASSSNARSHKERSDRTGPQLPPRSTARSRRVR